MKKKKIENFLAKGIALTLDTVLRIDANSTSCIVIYQPKAPESLLKYRKKENEG